MGSGDAVFSASVIKCRVNLDGTWAAVDPRFCELLGYTKQELQHLTFEDITHPDDKAAAAELSAKIKSGEIQEFDHEKRYITKGGNPVWVNVCGAVIRNNQGEAQYIRCFIYDLSAIKKTQEKLQETEQKFWSLFKNNPDPVYYFDLEGNFLEANDKMVEFGGYSREELRQKNFQSLIVEEDLGTNRKQFEEALKGEATPYEIQVTVQGGRKKDIRVTKFPHYIGGEVKGVFGILQDITKQKKRKQKIRESEQKFRGLFQHNPHSVFYLNTEGFFRGANPAFENLSGYQEKELHDKTFLHFVYPDYKELARRGFERTLEGQTLDIEMPGVTRNDELRTVQITTFPMYIEGEVLGVFGICEDVTEQRKAEKKLKQSEERFKSLFTHNPNAVYSLDEDGNFLTSNKALEELLGYSAEEMQSISFEPLVHPEDREFVQKKFKRAVQGDPQTYEARGIQRNGNIVEVRVTNMPIYVDGDIEGVFGVAQDITTEKNALSKLKESEERWQRLLEGSPQPVQIVQDGEIVFINQRGAELYGASHPEELNGEPILNFAHPETLEKIQDRKKRLEDQEQIESDEHRIVRLDGRVRYIEAHSIPITFKGKNAIQTVLHDITKRKEAENALKRNKERLSRLFSNLPGMAYRCMNNKKWPMVFVSDGSEELTGHRPEKFTEDNEDRIYYGDLIHPDDREHVWNEVQEAVNNDDPFEIEYRIIDKDDNQRWVWERGVPVRPAGEGVVMLEGFISDISKQKLAEQKIRENLEKKEVLLQEIHHRVKNNLAVISGLLELQLMNTDDEATTHTLRQSQMRIQSMAMIHQKLYQSEALSDVGFDQYVQELIDTIERTYDFSNKNISIEFELEPIKLNIDKAIPSALILNELVANCFEHAFDGQEVGTVRIVLERDSHENVLLHVIDDGKGLDPDFDIKSEQTLGMTLIKTLTNQLHGQLEVDSDPDATGTRVTVRFSVD